MLMVQIPLQWFLLQLTWKSKKAVDPYHRRIEDVRNIKIFQKLRLIL
ncbi:hypothetical protein GbCGDNIH6_8173 [Granulibacter bethesdensis]|nr:hypothetical protein GbCGDNIH6_8173 [Granulibacter bethesdensis]